jgi:hypothetical protein
MRHVTHDLYPAANGAHGVTLTADVVNGVLTFYTVGDVVMDVLKRKGNLNYQAYADVNGVYTRGNWPTYHAVIEAEWRPYLQGHITLQRAIRGMVDKMPPSLPEGH